MPRAGRGGVFPIMFLGMEGETLRSSEYKILVCGSQWSQSPLTKFPRVL